MAGLCNEGASQIMCRSLTNMFKGLHADKLHNCQFTCLRPTTTASEEDVSSEADHYSQEETQPETGPLSDSPSLLPSMIILLLSALFAR